jgi:DNA invertase Pin-like site-specific DNA recombinase
MRELEERAGEDPRRNLLGEMSTEEQLFFLERRVGRAFQQMMQSFNEMEREERKRIVERSLKRMKEERGGPARLEEADPEIAEKITEAGLKAYYEEANAETKLDLAPLLEEMQRSMSMMRGR